MSKRRPWQLPELLERDRNAATLYIALRWMAGDSRRLSTSRERIRAVCGLSPKCISRAMQALNAAGWVRVQYGRQGITAQWYRLSFPTKSVFPEGRKTTLSKRKSGHSPEGRKTTLSKVTGRAKNDPQQIVCCGAKNDPLPPYGGKAGSHRRPAPASAKAGTPVPPPTASEPVALGAPEEEWISTAEIARRVFGDGK